MSDNNITLACLYEHIDNPKLRFNTSKKNFVVPKGQPKKYKKLLSDPVNDDRFVELLEDDDLSIINIDMSEMLNEKLYNTVNYNIFHEEYNSNQDFRFVIDREIMSRGLGWQKDKLSCRKFIFLSWRNCVYGDSYHTSTVSGLLKSDKDYDETEPSMIISSRKRANTFIMAGFNYVWEMKGARPTCIADMKRVANTKKLKGDYTHPLYYIHKPKGFNEDDFRCNLRCIVDQYPRFKSMTLQEISERWDNNDEY